MQELSYIADGEIVTVMTQVEFEELRNKLLVLTNQGYHPRYTEPLDMMLQGAMKVLDEMAGDEKRSSSWGIGD